MESKEDIRLLELRIRHQMNASLQKNMKPENIKYYIPSAAMPKTEAQQVIHTGDADSGTPAADGAGAVSPADVVKGNTGLISVGAGNVFPAMAEPGAALPAAAGELPIDMENLDRAVGMPPTMEYEPIEIPESKEVQHARAMDGYEKSHSLDRRGAYEIENMHFLDAKG